MKLEIKTSFLILLILVFFTGTGIAGESEELFFADLWFGFQTEDELLAAKQENPETKETLEKEGIYYFLQATSLPQGDKDVKPLLEKSIATFNRLRKKDRRDHRNMIRLALALSAICGTDIPFEKIVENSTKANGFFSTVIDRLPQNMDARLGRIHLNIHLTPEMGRPDDILFDDAMVYLAGYEQLAPEEQQRPDIHMGVMIARLAAVIILDYRGEEDKVRELYQLIQPEPLSNAGLSPKYENLSKTYGVGK